MNRNINTLAERINNLQDLLRLCCEKYSDKTLVKIRKNNIYNEISYGKAWEDACSISKSFIEKGYQEEYIPMIGAFCYEWLIFFMAVQISGNIAIPLEDNSEICLQNIAELDAKTMYVDRKYTNSTYNIKDYLYTNCDHEGFVNVNQYKYEGEIELPVLDEQRVAMVVFTSGTTGKSKGVVLTHKNIVSDVKCCTTFIDDAIKDDSCILPILPVTHMFEVTVGIITAIFYGVTLCYGGGLKFFKKNMKEFKPDIMVLVPMIVENIYQKINQNDKQRKKISRAIVLSNILRKFGIDLRRRLFRAIYEQLGENLSVVICGGAYLSDEIVKWWDGIGVSVRCGYGITECSPVIACNCPEASCINSVGKVSPVQNCKVKIIDDEICISGDIVFKEYLNDRKATEEAFEGEYFKTGDLGYIDSDGYIFITGRKKNLIILGDGNNVSPEEIESYFSGEKIIKDMIVTLKQYEEREFITALIEIDKEYATEINCEEVSEYIWKIIEKINYKLPAYKRIKKMELIDGFEKTSLKKIKRYQYQKVKNGGKHV